MMEKVLKMHLNIFIINQPTDLGLNPDPGSWCSAHPGAQRLFPAWSLNS